MVRTVYLHLTSKCNSKCSYCYAEYSFEEISVKEWKFIIDKLSKNPPLKISITGGEPLLYNGIFNIASYLKIKFPKCIIRLYTNGYFVQQFEVKKYLIFDKIFISCDGGDEYTDSLRGKASSSHIRRALKHLSGYDLDIVAGVTVLPEAQIHEKKIISDRVVL